MGSVVKALDTRSGRLVAIKRLHGFLRTDSSYLERFEREAQVSMALSSRHTVQTLGVGEDNGESFLVMEFVQGTTLAELLRRRGKALSEVEACRIAYQAVRALEEAASKGIVHRDIKPENLIIQEDGTVKVADFGMAKFESVQFHGTVDTVGTIFYMAPERFAPGRFGGPSDSRSDLYSLGVVLYEMLAGVPPFVADSGGEIMRMHLEDPSQSLRLQKPDVSGQVSDLVEKCLAKQPGDRWQSAADLRTQLELIFPDVFRK